MTRRTQQRPHLPAGAWRRFFAALGVLLLVLIGVPALLVVCSRAGLSSSHPFPGIGSTDDIRTFFERDLTPTEIAPIAMRGLLIVAWVLWLGMTISVVASIFEARGSAARSWIPQFAMFAGLGRWIAAGLTAISSLAPNFVSAAALTSPRPFTISSVTAAQPVTTESPVPPGFARVQRGESIETFAQRLLGDANRWPELWELNRDERVGPDGEVWTAPWKVATGWDLRLPADAVPALPLAALASSDRPVGLSMAAPPVATLWTLRENLTVVDEYEVADGDSYWGIAERFLPSGSPERDVWEFTRALMTVNAPRLGYDQPAMLHPGDIVDIVAPTTSATPAAPDEAAETTTESEHRTPSHTVAAGDSFWEIAEATLGDEAAPVEVLQLTNELIDLNAARLDYGDQRLIHPGDVVYLAAPEVVEPAPPLLVPAGDDVRGAPSTTAAPTTTLPPPTTSSSTSSTSTTSTTTTTLPPPAGPEPVDAADTDTERGSPSPIGLGQAALISTGIVALVAARRRAKLRAAEPPARLPRPNPDTAATERMLRRLDVGERLLRVDIALRAAAAELADGDQRIVVVRCAPDGAVEVHLTAPVALSSPWSGADSRWVLPGSVPVDDLATRARAVGAPCIAVTQIGTDEDDWDVLVDIEAAGLLAVDADPQAADGVVRALAIGLASSEFAEVAHLVGVGIDEEAFLGHRHAHVVPTVDEAIELAATLIGGSTGTTTRSTFSLRARHTGGEMWEPTVVIVATSHAAEVSAAVTGSISPKGGLAFVVGASVADAPWTLRYDAAGWSLAPLGIRLRPVHVDSDELDELDDLVSLSATDTVVDDEPEDLYAAPHGSESVPSEFSALLQPERNGHNGHDVHAPAAILLPDRREEANVDHTDPPWSMMVRLLGNVQVVDREQRPARFERSKTLELVTWLVTHRARATRAAARTALWDLDVRDATFANVVSEARRAMARHVPPPADDEWLRRTMTDELSLHDEVIADADVVRARFDKARSVGGADALELLRPAVELVNELPFTGTGYLWPDAEGITSNLVLLATNATAEFAKLALARGDFDGVFWATGRGLQVLAGQETLIALRMRAHAEAGDLSGVRLEWESYERVINADPWSDGEPAPKLLMLRKELLSH